MSLLDSLDWSAVRQHYSDRRSAHRELIALADSGSIEPFVRLLLGISDVTGNYSAAEHGLGPLVLGENHNSARRVFDLAQEFRSVASAHEVPPLIRRAGLSYLQIGVGSEASCMMNPNICWVANTRSIWTYLLYKHDGDYRRAEEELQLYWSSDPSSEMAYQLWRGLHRELGSKLPQIAEEASIMARAAGVKPGGLAFLWADAVANSLYENR